MAEMGSAGAGEWAATYALPDKIAGLGAGEKPVYDSALGGAGGIAQGFLSAE